MKKKCSNILGIILFFIFFLSVLNFPIDQSVNVNDLEFSDEKYIKISIFDNEEILLSINGTVKNTSNHTIRYIFIEYTLYDYENRTIGKATENIIFLKSGECKNYSATCCIKAKYEYYRLTKIQVN